MRCRGVETRLPLLSGGDLPWWQRVILEWHLRRCPGCRRELHELGRARELFRTSIRSMEGGKTDDLWERVLYRLPQERRAAAASVPPRPKRHGLMFVPAAAAIAVVLILMFSGDGTRRRNGTPSQLDAVRSKIPLVKPTDHGVTVLTFQTDDPRVTIAWFFEEEPTEEEEN